MLRNRFYYAIKPMLPSWIRLEVRRKVSLYRKPQFNDVWPILPGSEKKPAGWKGWPDGKEFALVLTHDVEGKRGIKNHRKLMELETKLGFRSSFNFIPEGKYRVTKELRDDLTMNGFEVGVHDLYHDGKLYDSRDGFSRRAGVINTYLRDWGAGGFRSGFMFHNLEWLHDLNVQYDSSTFDTDPFEPQCDGVSTIFPFWKESSDGRGYVELPYTLPQDSTLFILFGEKTHDIWLRKLDWIASHGGMALVNVHPDYMQFPGDGPHRHGYSVDIYGDFLRIVSEKYGDRFWKALPRDVASWYGNASGASSRALNGAKVPIQVAGQHLVTNGAARNGGSCREEPDHSTVARNGKPTEALKTDAPAPFNIVPTSPKPKIWIDLDNTPHVVFFEPILDELRARGYPLLVTARDAFQVCELADRRKVAYTRVGHHYGKNSALKIAGLLVRAAQLAPYALREKPVLSVSHGARSQILVSNALKIPSLLMADYEYAKYPPMMRPTWEMVPSVISNDKLCRDHEHVLRYPGIKEDAYVWKFEPSGGLMEQLGLKESEVIITVRPPATEAHYHNPESEKLFVAFMEYVCRYPEARVVLLPRNHRQSDFLRGRYPEWFANNKTVIPPVLDGLNLIWHSDLLVSGGGTMNREATALGVPVYSIFLGAIGEVDRHLEKTGRLVLIKTVADIAAKIPLKKRPAISQSDRRPTQTFTHIVKIIEELAEGAPKMRRSH